MTTYRWAVVDKDGSILYGSICSTRESAELTHLMLNGTGYRVAKFKLVECEEGEGEWRMN